MEKKRHILLWSWERKAKREGREAGRVGREREQRKRRERQKVMGM